MHAANRRKFLAGTIAAASLTGLSRKACAAKSRIKIGQIGTQHAHASKLAAYRNLDDYDVVGIVEPNMDARHRAEKQPAFQGLHWMSQEELLNLSGLQAVLVETDVSRLLNTAAVCVEAGVHIHLDKPAGDSLHQYKQILGRAAQQNLLVQMGYMYRYNPAVVLLRDFLRNGWLGDVFEVHAVMSKVVDAAARRELAKFPGGMMFELGCHIIDLVVGVLGAPDAVSAFSRHSAAQTDGLNDNMLAVFEYSRSLATVKTSALEIDDGARRHLVVCGTEGTFHIQPLDNPSAKISLSRSRGEYAKGTSNVNFPKYTRYVADAADMARIIRGEKAADFPYEHDLAVQTALLKACALPLDV